MSIVSFFQDEFFAYLIFQISRVIGRAETLGLSRDLVIKPFGQPGVVGHLNIQTPPIVPLPPWRKTGSRPLQTGLQFQKSHPSICKLNVEGNHEQFLKHLSIGARRRYDTKSLPLIIYLAENLEIIYKATPKIFKTKIKECPMKGQLLQKWSQILCSVVGSALSEIEEWQC